MNEHEIRIELTSIQIDNPILNTETAIPVIERYINNIVLEYKNTTEHKYESILCDGDLLKSRLYVWALFILNSIAMLLSLLIIDPLLKLKQDTAIYICIMVSTLFYLMSLSQFFAMQLCFRQKLINIQEYIVENNFENPAIIAVLLWLDNKIHKYISVLGVFIILASLIDIYIFLFTEVSLEKMYFYTYYVGFLLYLILIPTNLYLLYKWIKHWRKK